MANPYKMGAPEWLLQANIDSAELAAGAFAKDAERYAEKAEVERNKAATFRAALAKLTAADPA